MSEQKHPFQGHPDLTAVMLQIAHDVAIPSSIWQGLVDEINEVCGQLLTLKQENATLMSRINELEEALVYLIDDVRRKPNDTRYSTAIRKATEALKNKQP